MLKFFLTLSVLIFLPFAASHAERAASLEEARQLSAQTGKPILMEFVHQD